MTATKPGTETLPQSPAKTADAPCEYDPPDDGLSRWPRVMDGLPAPKSRRRRKQKKGVAQSVTLLEYVGRMRKDGGSRGASVAVVLCCAMRRTVLTYTAEAEALA